MPYRPKRQIAVAFYSMSPSGLTSSALVSATAQCNNLFLVAHLSRLQRNDYFKLLACAFICAHASLDFALLLLHLIDDVDHMNHSDDIILNDQLVLDTCQFRFPHAHVLDTCQFRFPHAHRFPHAFSGRALGWEGAG